MKTAAMLLGVAGFFLATSPQVRAAGGDDTPSGGRPWAENVPKERQDQALLIYEEANKLFEDSKHAAALTKYREALKAWDHPAIHYNAAVALIFLDQPLAAYEDLEAALKYGAAPFNADTHQQALTYRKLLRGQLAELKVTCAEPAAEVALDGRPLFAGPGEATRRLLPGPHQLVARKPGFLTETRMLTLLPGNPVSETLRLQEIHTLQTKTVRRWPVWKPLAVVGAGVVVAAIGVPFSFLAKSKFDVLDSWTREKCSNSGTGCAVGTVPPQSAIAARDRGLVYNVIAVSLYSVGAAVAATGVVLAIMNQPHVVPADQAPRTLVTPLVGPGVIGVSLAFLR